MMQSYLINLLGNFLNFSGKPNFPNDIPNDSPCEIPDRTIPEVPVKQPNEASLKF